MKTEANFRFSDKLRLPKYAQTVVVAIIRIFIKCFMYAPDFNLLLLTTAI